MKNLKQNRFLNGDGAYAISIRISYKWLLLIFIIIIGFSCYIIGVKTAGGYNQNLQVDVVYGKGKINGGMKATDRYNELRGMVIEKARTKKRKGEWRIDLAKNLRIGIIVASFLISVVSAVNGKHVKGDTSEAEMANFDRVKAKWKIQIMVISAVSLCINSSADYLTVNGNEFKKEGEELIELIAQFQDKVNVITNEAELKTVVDAFELSYYKR